MLRKKNNVLPPCLEDRLKNMRRVQSMAPLSSARLSISTNNRYNGFLNGKNSYSSVSHFDGHFNGTSIKKFRPGKIVVPPKENLEVDMNVIRSSDKKVEIYEVKLESLITGWEKMVNSQMRRSRRGNINKKKNLNNLDRKLSKKEQYLQAIRA
eukprot:TRINITY_DN6553_c0_g1_i4.p3 TRINITY_DN6553_c0_g1~~TRINITY_DN6553_c0_g1_i4.p3  ORF type:complete len:153 (+),score=25.79 TRINITY_DN6553_c0_g1_i4:303-761(+)